MTKSGATRILRVVAAFVIAILCVSMFLSRTLTPVPHKEQHLNGGEVEPGRDDDKLKSNKKFGQEEIDFDVRTGGRFSIGSGGDPGFIDLPVSDVLLPDLIPPDVHFLWCGTTWFEFKHYLSVMSVRRMIQPDKIYIHFEQEPGLDRVYYNQASDILLLIYL